MRAPVRVVVALASRDGRYLVCKRIGGKHAGCWEFPGGKVEPGESDADALVRELDEELGVRAVVLGDMLTEIEVLAHDPPFKAALYRVAFTGAPMLRVHSGRMWLPRGRLAAVVEHGRVTPAMPLFLPAVP